MQSVLENQKKGNKNAAISNYEVFGFVYAFLILE